MTERQTNVVLREGTEGLSTQTYADVLLERLSTDEIRRAGTIHEEEAMIADADIATGREIDVRLLASRRPNASASSPAPPPGTDTFPSRNSTNGASP